MCRYLLHMDDADKHQYGKEEINTLGGISLDFSRKYSRDEELAILADITAFVEDNDITEYATLWRHAARTDYAWLDILAGKASYALASTSALGPSPRRSAGARHRTWAIRPVLEFRAGLALCP